MLSVYIKGDRYQYGGKGAAPFSVIGNQDYYGSDFTLHNGKVHFHRSAFFATPNSILNDHKDRTENKTLSLSL